MSDLPQRTPDQIPSVPSPGALSPYLTEVPFELTGLMSRTARPNATDRPAAASGHQGVRGPDITVPDTPSETEETVRQLEPPKPLEQLVRPNEVDPEEKAGASREAALGSIAASANVERESDAPDPRVTPDTSATGTVEAVGAPDAPTQQGSEATLPNGEHAANHTEPYRHKTVQLPDTYYNRALFEQAVCVSGNVTKATDAAFARIVRRRTEISAATDNAPVVAMHMAPAASALSQPAPDDAPYKVTNAHILHPYEGPLRLLSTEQVAIVIGHGLSLGNSTTGDAYAAAIRLIGKSLETQITNPATGEVRLQTPTLPMIFDGIQLLCKAAEIGDKPDDVNLTHAQATQVKASIPPETFKHLASYLPPLRCALVDIVYKVPPQETSQQPTDGRPVLMNFGVGGYGPNLGKEMAIAAHLLPVLASGATDLGRLAALGVAKAGNVDPAIATGLIEQSRTPVILSECTIIPNRTAHLLTGTAVYVTRAIPPSARTIAEYFGMLEGERVTGQTISTGGGFNDGDSTGQSKGFEAGDYAKNRGTSASETSGTAYSVSRNQSIAVGSIPVTDQHHLSRGLGPHEIAAYDTFGFPLGAYNINTGEWVRDFPPLPKQEPIKVDTEIDYLRGLHDSKIPAIDGNVAPAAIEGAPVERAQPKSKSQPAQSHTRRAPKVSGRTLPTMPPPPAQSMPKTNARCQDVRRMARWFEAQVGGPDGRRQRAFEGLLAKKPTLAFEHYCYTDFFLKKHPEFAGLDKTDPKVLEAWNSWVRERNGLKKWW